MRLALAAPALTRAQAPSQSLSGLWDAAVVVNGLEIPFRFEIAGSGAAISGSFFNGDEKVTSTGGKFENGSLTLNFDHYATADRSRARQRPAGRRLQPRHRLLSVLREALHAAGGVPERSAGDRRALDDRRRQQQQG